MRNNVTLTHTYKPEPNPVNAGDTNTVATREPAKATPQGSYKDHSTRFDTVLDLGGQTLTDILDVGNDEGNGPAAADDGTNRYRSPTLPTASPTLTQEGRPEHSRAQREAVEGIQQVHKRVQTARASSDEQNVEKLQRQIESTRKRVNVRSAIGAAVIGPAIYAVWKGVTSATPLEDPLTYVGSGLVLAVFAIWLDAFVKCADGKLRLPEAPSQAAQPG